jgi:hypothetical protein
MLQNTSSQSLRRITFAVYVGWLVILLTSASTNWRDNDELSSYYSSTRVPYLFPKGGRRMINANTNGRFQCSCKAWMGLPSRGSRVTGLSCHQCPRFWEIKYSRAEILGRNVAWHCSGCDSTDSVCRRIPRWCPSVKEQ